jgi:excisionase family DNA binding protein
MNHAVDTSSGDHLLTPDELAEILRISRNTVVDWASRRPERLPPPVRMGRLLRWSRHSVDAWLQSAVQQTPRARRPGRPRKRS